MKEKKKSRSSTASARTGKRKSARARALRNRIIALCVILILLVVLIVFAVGKYMGLFDKAPQETTITLTEDGTVICEEVTSFDESYYSKKELKKDIKSEIASYNEKAGKNKVKLNRLQVKKDMAYAKTTYASAKDYRAFTGIEMYAGKMKKALKSYAFEDAFVTVKEGTKGASAETLDITSQADLKVLVIKENVAVTVSGEILYVSDAATTMVDEHTVRISQPDGNEDATQLTYIIYK